MLGGVILNLFMVKYDFLLEKFLSQIIVIIKINPDGRRAD